MTSAQIITLIIAVLGVLHGPLTGQILSILRSSQNTNTPAPKQ